MKCELTYCDEEVEEGRAKCESHWFLYGDMIPAPLPPRPPRQPARCRKKLANAVKRYGLTLEEYERRVEDQGGRCAICDGTPTRGPYDRLAVDHDHETGDVRGLLCQTCNAGIGMLQDDSALVERAAEYLRRFGK